ncbi:MAG: HDIG domain-containing metalloprotein [Thermodesulfobacteriota bacterium]
MPSIEKHVEISRRRTGKDYLELHEWIDKDPVKKVERHDITKIYEYGKMMEEKYGPEGLQEYLRHIHDDFTARFGHVKEDVEKAIGDTLAYFGVKPDPDAKKKAYGLSTADIDLLKRAGLSDKDLGHSIRVALKALDVAVRLTVPVDMELVGRGALLHDLGKAKGRGFDHGVAGAQLGRSLGLPDALTAIMERHVNAGLTAEEATELGLPPTSYTPTRLEERIVIYADKLSDIVSHPDGLVANDAEAEERFAEILKVYPALSKGEKPLTRHLKYHKEIQGLMKGKA